MKPTIIRIATRKSPLAIWQANYVKEKLLSLHPNLIVELTGIMTEGDKLIATPLNQIGGKGLFIKALETAVLECHADIAVHSLKDVPYELLGGFSIAAYCERDDPRDALISNQYPDLKTLPKHAIVGTSSLRRQCQLKTMRPDLRVENLRGNVSTRLRKLDDGHYHAIILAAVSLERLGLKQRIKHYFTTEEILPSVGQGVICMECRSDDLHVQSLLKSLDHQSTRICVSAERAMNARLGGSCQFPIAAYAILQDHQLILHGLVGTPDGRKILRAKLTGEPEQPERLGKTLAEKLLAQGADKILQGL